MLNVLAKLMLMTGDYAICSLQYGICLYLGLMHLNALRNWSFLLIH